MLTIDELRGAMSEAGAPWQATETPVVRLLRGAQGGTLFGLSLTEEERIDQLTEAERLEAETGLLAAAGPPPPAADWREGGFVTPVRHQQTCSACVAFATCASLEARVRMLRQDSSIEIDLSEADLFFGGCGSCCAEGWNFPPAFERASLVGIGAEDGFPYSPENQPAVDIPPIVRVTERTAEVTIEGRKQAIATNGPVIGGMHTFEDLSYYAGGIYRHVAGQELQLHAVCIVGYNDRDGCWIVKNSWGEDWGEGGFLRIAYGEAGLDSEFPFYDLDLTYLDTP